MPLKRHSWNLNLESMARAGKDSTQTPPIYVPVLGSKKGKLILKYTHSLFICVFFFQLVKVGHIHHPHKERSYAKTRSRKYPALPNRR